MAENAPQALKTLAYLHPVSDRCVTTDASAYSNPRELVCKAQAQEQIKDLRDGLQQWRAIAADAIALAARLKSAGAIWGTITVSEQDRQAIARLAAWQDLTAPDAPATSAEPFQAHASVAPLQGAAGRSLAQNLETVRDYVGRTTHWTEGGADRHDAIESLKKVPEQIQMLVNCANIGQDELGWYALRVATPGQQNRLGRGPDAWAAVQDANQNRAESGAHRG